MASGIAAAAEVVDARVKWRGVDKRAGQSETRLRAENGHRAFAFAGALLLLFIALLANAPIRQLAGYHDFADDRTILGIAHFWNLASNAPFLVIGLLGVDLVRRLQTTAKLEWTVFFAATALVALGSSYYHWAPSDTTLVWDRVPIGVAFMAFFAALVAEHIDERAGRRILVPAIAFAAAAIYWFRATGDLSAWMFAQLGPMLGAALALALFPARHTYRRYLGYALACYAAAKLLELGDRQLMDWTGGFMSGHALKHFAAAAGVGCIYVMLAKRRELRIRA